MIDFNDELKRYEPMLEMDNIEDSINSSEIKDIFDLLQHVYENVKRNN